MSKNLVVVMKLKSAFIFFTLLLVFPVLANQESVYMSKISYVQQWKDVAIEQMDKYKIPASIILAQAIIESAYGNSKLAIEANNHFGIKCHDWKGKVIHKVDDQVDDCFRVYETAKESYEDHSILLSSKNRYSELFKLKITDYKSWAKGLKEAGYASNPDYANLLISTIEELKLNEFDFKCNNSQNFITSTSMDSKAVDENQRIVLKDETGQYIIAEKGDTFYQLSLAYGTSLRKLRKINQFESTKDFISEGDKVYIQ